MKKNQSAMQSECKKRLFLPCYVHPIRSNYAVYRWENELKLSAHKVEEFYTYDLAREAAYRWNGEYLREKRKR